jgi:cytochrome c5
VRTVAILLLVLSPAAFAQDVKLRGGPGREVVAAKCAICHSLDYISMNSPFLDQAGWERTVRKMIDVMGAPLEDKDVLVVLDYLAHSYGK